MPLTTILKSDILMSIAPWWPSIEMAPSRSMVPLPLASRAESAALTGSAKSASLPSRSTFSAPSVVVMVLATNGDCT